MAKDKVKTAEVEKDGMRTFIVPGGSFVRFVIKAESVTYDERRQAVRHPGKRAVFDHGRLTTSDPEIIEFCLSRRPEIIEEPLVTAKEPNLEGKRQNINYLYADLRQSIR